MQTVYFISGLGADKRAFQYLDLSFCNPVFIEWIRPVRGENITSYAARLKEQIKDEEPVIVGLSFGGMIGVEIARLITVKKLILLSSAKTAREIPYYFRYFRYLPVHKFLSPSFFRSANQTFYRLMGIASRKDKVLFTGMFKDADDHFIVWAIDQIINWKNDSVPVNTVHIHGTADILLPYKYIKADHAIEGGEHLMLMLKADTISKILKQVIAGD